MDQAAHRLSLESEAFNKATCEYADSAVFSGPNSSPAP